MEDRQEWKKMQKRRIGSQRRWIFLEPIHTHELRHCCRWLCVFFCLYCACVDRRSVRRVACVCDVCVALLSWWALRSKCAGLRVSGCKQRLCAAEQKQNKNVCLRAGKNAEMQRITTWTSDHVLQLTRREGKSMRGNLDQFQIFARNSEKTNYLFVM